MCSYVKSVPNKSSRTFEEGIYPEILKEMHYTQNESQTGGKPFKTLTEKNEYDYLPLWLVNLTKKEIVSQL